jgi:hypothetical protein
MTANPVTRSFLEYLLVSAMKSRPAMDSGCSKIRKLAQIGFT